MKLKLILIASLISCTAFSGDLYWTTNGTVEHAQCEIIAMHSNGSQNGYQLECDSEIDSLQSPKKNTIAFIESPSGERSALYCKLFHSMVLDFNAFTIALDCD